jgi:hypothetical protein
MMIREFAIVWCHLYLCQVAEDPCSHVLKYIVTETSIVLKVDCHFRVFLLLL